MLCVAIVSMSTNFLNARDLFVPKTPLPMAVGTNQKTERIFKKPADKLAKPIRTFGAKAPSALSKVLHKAPAATASIAVQFIDTDEFEPQAFCVVNSSGVYWLEQINEDFTGNLDVPEGEYVAIGLTMHYINEWEGYFVYTVKENVSVPASLVIDPTESTSEIRIEALTPAGQPFELPTYRIDGTDWENAEEVLVSPGNISQTTVRTTLYHPELGELFWDESSGSGNIEGSDLEEESKFDYAVRINPGCENIIVNMKQTGKVSDWQAPYVVSVSQQGTSSATLTNSPSNYVDVITNFAQSGIGNKIMEENGFPFDDELYAINTGTYVNGTMISGLRESGSTPMAMSVRYCGEESGLFTEFVTPERYDCTLDYSVEVEDLGDGMYMETTSFFQSNSTAPMVAFDADANPVILPLTNDVFYAGPSAPESIFDRVPALFAQSSIQRSVPLGTTPVYNSIPVITPLNPETGERFFFLFMLGTGYHGETVGTYNNASEYKVLYNGVDAGYVAEEYADFWSGGFWGWCLDRASESHPAGAYDISMSSAMIIDGVEGSLSVNYHFDFTKEDFTAPALQYLQLRDKEGRIRYEFDYPEQAVLNVMAGDFEWTDLPADYVGAEGGYLSPKAGAEPQLSYAPFGTGDWKGLSIEKQSDIDGCFAPSYSAQLAQIDEIANEGGYFDIKITLSDESGNSMEQIISPAFRINSLGSIASADVSGRNLTWHDGIVSSDNGFDIAIYSMAGVKVLEGQGRLDASRLPKGLYVAVSGNSAIKIAVK